MPTKAPGLDFGQTQLRIKRIGGKKITNWYKLLNPESFAAEDEAGEVPGLQHVNKSFVIQLFPLVDFALRQREKKPNGEYFHCDLVFLPSSRKNELSHSVLQLFDNSLDSDVSGNMAIIGQMGTAESWHCEKGSEHREKHFSKISSTHITGSDLQGLDLNTS